LQKHLLGILLTADETASVEFSLPRGRSRFIFPRVPALPIGSGVDSAIFNPKTMETYSAQVDDTLTIVKEKSPTRFVVEQTVETKPGAKQMVWDSKTNRILLVAADYGPAPSPAPGGAAAGRGPMAPDSFSVLS
jgi:hypothetical protein